MNYGAGGGDISPSAQQLAKDLKVVEEEVPGMDEWLVDVTKTTYTYEELVDATSEFEEVLGEGSLGTVCKGVIDGEVVAVKQLKSNEYRCLFAFVSEVVTLSKANHQNIVQLMGYCAEGGERLLVLEFMPLGSLDKCLHGLDWATRMKVARDIARGLEYLHSSSIFHGDISSANIFVDQGLNAKIGDFGQAGRGENTEEDIHQFGLVLLELATGQKAVDHGRVREHVHLFDWAKAHLPLENPSELPQVVDPVLEGGYVEAELMRVLGIAMMCLEEGDEDKPSASDLVNLLGEA